MSGYSLMFVPKSWLFKAVEFLRDDNKTKKILYAVGPFRFVIHRHLEKDLY